jgi:hypothetical protein
MARKREVIEADPGDKRYARRGAGDHFTSDQTDVGKSVSSDMRTHAKKVVPKGQDDSRRSKSERRNRLGSRTQAQRLCESVSAFSGKSPIPNSSTQRLFCST